MTITQASDTVDHSTYSKVLALYTRDADDQLTFFENKNGFNIEKNWKQVITKAHSIDRKLAAFNIDSDGFTTYKVSREDLVAGTAVDGNAEDIIPEHYEDIDGLLVLEYTDACEAGQVRGLIMVDYQTQYDEAAEGTFDPKLKAFHDWFSRLIVRDTRVHFSATPPLYDADKATAKKVTKFFAEHLKNSTVNDLWNQGGEEYFIERVHHFTSRNLQIESVLPAFPCKSSNREKVNGMFPDKGEELAMRRLLHVTRMARDIYSPGWKVYIVSDGHVFSDCIGVDDDVVDSYTEKLRYLHSKIIASGEYQRESIGFVSLKDLFFNKMASDFDVNSLIENVELPHYTDSKICDDSEQSRKLLMSGCDTDAGKLRRDISQPDHPRLHLYRGFSRFMTEDLSLHPFCKTLSNKAFKKTVSKVAFEMIKRNDAYSNLVELLFPFHLRLSIHAHLNNGPKFGVRLISIDECRTIKALECDEEPSFEDLLHIPTPWHNCVVKIEGHQLYFLTKSKIVQEAIDKGHYEGEWIATEADKGKGGFFTIKQNAPAAATIVSQINTKAE